MISDHLHEKYMKRCFELATEGLGFVAPNPMVGSVIVFNDRIIGEGYHKKFGQAHAEVNAIESVSDKTLLKSSTLYVNLEPCAHYGKTPPCSDLIIKMGIPRVVISNTDPNPLVMGKGIEKMRRAGIEVITEILKSEGEELNKRFFTYILKSRPYIILKWAQTSDGFIDIHRDVSSPQKPNWITNQYARMLVHKWRSEEQSIMVGTNTALLDNPRLNVRDWSGNSPLRIVLDRSLRLPSDLHLFDGSLPTLIFTENQKKTTENRNNKICFTVFDEYLPEHIIKELFNQKIQSIIIEGGTRLLQSFIDVGLWDEARVFVGNVYFKSGKPAPVIGFKPALSEINTRFLLNIYKNSIL